MIDSRSFESWFLARANYLPSKQRNLRYEKREPFDVLAASQLELTPTPESRATRGFAWWVTCQIKRSYWSRISVVRWLGRDWARVDVGECETSTVCCKWLSWSDLNQHCDWLTIANCCFMITHAHFIFPHKPKQISRERFILAWLSFSLMLSFWQIGKLNINMM